MRLTMNLRLIANLKGADDLRQDVLGIQMLRMIDSIWKQGWTGPQSNKDYILDMNLTPYDVLSTPKYNPNKLDEDAFREFGFIQKINGRTLSDIQANHQVMFERSCDSRTI